MYIPGFNQSDYIAVRRETPGKCGFIQVFRNQGKDQYEPYWKLMPKPSNPPIAALFVLQSAVLLSIDQNGTVLTYDIDNKKKLTETILDASDIWGCVLIKEENEVTVFYTKNGDFHIRSCLLEIASGKVEHSREYKNLNKIIAPTIISRSEVAAYCPVGGSNRSIANDLFVRINFENGKVQEAELTPSPTGNFSIPPVVICPEYNFGARPSYHPVKIENNAAQKRYWAGLDLFDLDSGKLKHSIKTRAFNPEDVFEDDDPSYALSCFELSPLADDYRDVRDEFMERFDSLLYSPLQHSIWISYQHGLLQRLSLDSLCASPLFLHPGDSDAESISPFRRTRFDTPISLTPDKNYLHFGDPETVIDTRGLTRHSEKEWIDIPGQSIIASDLKLFNIVEPEFSWVQVNIKGPNSADASENGMRQLLELVNDIPSMKDGNLLRFRFVTESGTQISEKEFFKTAAETDRLHGLMADFIDCIINQDQPLLYNDELPAGFYAVKSLISANPGYIKLLTTYLNSAVMPGHTPKDLLELVDKTIKDFSWANESIDLILNLAYFHNESGIEKLLNWTSSDSFAAYLEKTDDNYLESHTLYRSLIDEHFATFRPLEEKLFSAIEYEDTDVINEILKDQPDLTVQHPDFKMTALELAFEVNNREIIQILIDAGAKELGDGYLTLDELIDALNETVTKDTDLHTDQINALQKQKFQIQNEISKIEFNQMVTFQLTKEDQERLHHLNQSLKEIQTQLKYMNLGLFNFNINKADSNNEETIHRPFLKKNSDDFIDEKSILEIEPKDTTVYIDNLDESSQIDAFNQICNLINKLGNLSKHDTFRIGFDLNGKLFSEQAYFSKIKLTSQSSSFLENAINNLLKAFDHPAWYDADTPTLFFPVQALSLFREDHLGTLVGYLNFISHFKEEPSCISELIFDVFDHYSWSYETLNLAAYRFTLQNNDAANVEIRLQLKKGGLRGYLSIEPNFKSFTDLLIRHSDSRETADVLTSKMLSLLQSQAK